MANYTVFLSKKAEKALDKIPDVFACSILDSIEQLSINPRPYGYKKLKGRNAYRIRTGNYRIIYEIIDNQLIVEVVEVGHRKEIYQL